MPSNGFLVLEWIVWLPVRFVPTNWGEVTCDEILLKLL